MVVRPIESPRRVKFGILISKDMKPCDDFLFVGCAQRPNHICH
jgi:hypothetical protein